MTRRGALDGITFQQRTHAGLWLDKYLENDEAGSKQKLIEEACGIKFLDDKVTIPQGYTQAFKSRFAPKNRPPNTVCAKATVDNCRLIIGLGQKGELEAGITLDHTWGVPYIPGSALKGIAAWAALQSTEAVWNKVIKISGNKRRVGDCYLALFGGPDDKEKDEKGCVIFHDAWWISDGNKLPLHLDVMTVHHQKYYQEENASPSDMDSPVPVPFVSVTGKFQVMLEGPEEWCEVAYKLLEYGLKEHGVGAKTAGGYGRMLVSEKEKYWTREDKKQLDEICDLLQKNMEEFQNKLNSLPTNWPSEIKEELIKAVSKKEGKKKKRK